ncbi:ankyrin [Xylaria sp. CBS 124048]|nr:ankyrin [Xylaria sp. CBS 124048]
MAPKLSKDEIDDLVYLARAGEDADLTAMLKELAVRETATPADILIAAREEPSKATCLHMAAANGHAKTVTIILSYLPLPTKGSSSAAAAAAAPSSTVSEEASSPPQKDCAYIDLQNSFGNSALHWACLRGHLDVVRLLLSRGASPTVENGKEQIPLDLAVFNNHMHVVDFFLSQSKEMEGDNATGDGGGLVQGTGDLDVQEKAKDVGEEEEEEAEMSG